MRLIDGDALWHEIIHYTNYCDDILELIEKMPTVPQWIPVSERLPEYGVEVLTINKDDEYEINLIIDDEDGEWLLDGVIAWMSFPEPYHEWS